MAEHHQSGRISRRQPWHDVKLALFDDEPFEHQAGQGGLHPPQVQVELCRDGAVRRRASEGDQVIENGTPGNRIAELMINYLASQMASRCADACRSGLMKVSGTKARWRAVNPANAFSSAEWPRFAVTSRQAQAPCCRASSFN